MLTFKSAFNLLLLIIVCAPALIAQVTPGAGGKAKEHGDQQIYAGYSYLSNDFRGSYFGNGGMNGWEAAYAAPLTKSLDFKVSSFGYSKNVSYATQTPIFFVFGMQYTKKIKKESIFADGLVGLVHINSDWFYGNGQGSGAPNNSFAAVAGGGIDTPISKQFAWRAEGSMVHSNIGVGDDQIHGLANFFFRASTGLVFRF